MATYLEIFDIALGSGDRADLEQKVAVATVVKAVAVLAEASPTQIRIDWAADALENPRGNALFSYVLGDNKDATVIQITGASDASVQTAVDTAVDALYP